MDDSILTPRQRLNVVALRLAQSHSYDDVIEGDITYGDLQRIILNREFMENGIEGVRLIESQVGSE